jgi:hypothetical protein
MGDHEECRVWRTLGQGEELPGQLYGLLRFRPHGVKVPDPPQGGKELRRLSDLLAELARSIVRLLNFEGGISPGDHQRGAERGLQLQFVLQVGGRFHKLLEQGNPLRQVTHGLNVSGALDSSPTCPLQWDRLRTTGVVIGDRFGCVSVVSANSRSSTGNRLMDLLPLAPQHR